MQHSIKHISPQPRQDGQIDHPGRAGWYLKKVGSGFERGLNNETFAMLEASLFAYPPPLRLGTCDLTAQHAQTSPALRKRARALGDQITCLSYANMKQDADMYT